jgi:hypothetical protein
MSDLHPTEREKALLDAGDALIDDLSVLLSAEGVEAIADMLGLATAAHMEAWEATAKGVDPRL